MVHRLVRPWPPKSDLGLTGRGVWAILAVAASGVVEGCGARPCPSEMAAIRSGDQVLYCIDRHEVSVSIQDENAALDEPAAPFIARGTFRSQAGSLPVLRISYDDAVGLCEKTPVVMDGVTVGYKRMPSLDEWLDAADGVVGPGGSAFPYGESYEPGRCNHGDPEHGKLQLTGSFPGCKSAFGVFDQLGNAFEWADSGIRIDIAATLEAFAKRGLQLEIGDGGVLRVAESDARRLLRCDAAGMKPLTLRRDADGHLSQGTYGSKQHAAGILVFKDRPISSSNALPVAFLCEAGEERCTMMLRRNDEGQTVPVKVGGAFYTKSPWPDAAMNHTHDFDGTITFRCASDPVK